MQSDHPMPPPNFASQQPLPGQGNPIPSTLTDYPSPPPGSQAFTGLSDYPSPPTGLGDRPGFTTQPSMGPGGPGAPSFSPMDQPPGGAFGGPSTDYPAPSFSDQPGLPPLSNSGPSSRSPMLASQPSFPSPAGPSPLGSPPLDFSQQGAAAFPASQNFSSPGLPPYDQAPMRSGTGLLQEQSTYAQPTITGPGYMPPSGPLRGFTGPLQTDQSDNVPPGPSRGFTGPFPPGQPDYPPAYPPSSPPAFSGPPLPMDQPGLPTYGSSPGPEQPLPWMQGPPPDMGFTPIPGPPAGLGGPFGQEGPGPGLFQGGPSGPPVAMGSPTPPMSGPFVPGPLAPPWQSPGTEPAPKAKERREDADTYLVRRAEGRPSHGKLSYAILGIGFFTWVTMLFCLSSSKWRSNYIGVLGYSGSRHWGLFVVEGQRRQWHSAIMQDNCLWWGGLHVGGLCTSPICLWYRVKCQVYWEITLLGYLCGLVLVIAWIFHGFALVHTYRCTPEKIKLACRFWWLVFVIYAVAISVHFFLMEEQFGELAQYSFYPKPDPGIAFLAACFAVLLHLGMGFAGCSLSSMWPIVEGEDESLSDSDEDDDEGDASKGRFPAGQPMPYSQQAVAPPPGVPQQMPPYSPGPCPMPEAVARGM